MATKNTKGKKKSSSSRSKKRKSKRNKRLFKAGIVILCVAVIAVIVFLFVRQRNVAWQKQDAVSEEDEEWEGAPEIDVDLLTINPYSRPGILLSEVDGIVVHYTANPGSTALENRNYFENLKDTHENKVSSHFVIGMDGEIIQCIPSSEIAYASNSRNTDTLSIECCHPDETGMFTEATCQSLVQLTAWLCRRFGLDVEEDVIRHFDVTGKDCPLYYVENPEAWADLKKEMQARVDELNELYG